MAEGLNAALVVTNVAPGDDSAENVTHYGHDRLEQARAYLAERGLDAELVQSTGQPAEAIVSLADERKADLIVVGMRKKGFFERLVEEASRRTSCDVRRATCSPFTDPLNDPRLILAGLITGLLVGMTGMGGGALMTPLLIFLFNFNPATAIGTDILHGAIFKSFGAVSTGGSAPCARGWRGGCWSGAPSSLLGVWTATYLTDRYGDSVDSVQGQVLGYAPVRGARVRRQGARASERTGGEPRAPDDGDRIVAVSIGLAGGFIVGLTSVGSGTLFALAMLLAFPLAGEVRRRDRHRPRGGPALGRRDRTPGRR